MEDFNEAMSNIEDGIEGAKSEAKADVAALTTAIGTKGKTCRIATGSYVGTGSGGQNGANTLTFDFTPLVVFVAGPADVSNQIMVWPCPYANNRASIDARVQWSDHSVSWYCIGNGTDVRAYQCNVEGVTYYYAALGAAD